MANSDETHEQAADQPSFEKSLAELEAIVHDLEDGQLGLADALARYEQGIAHLKNCYHLLAAAERKIELLTGISADGTALTESLEDGGVPIAESAGRKRRTRKSAPADSTLPLKDAGRDIDDHGAST